MERAPAASGGDADAPAIAVVDYGLGNLHSVTRGLERAGATVEITADPDRFHAADGVVLPGVGAFREGIENAEPIREELVAVADGPTPLFGICLGMQMLLTDSEEGQNAGESAVRGLDLIPGTNVRFDGGQKVPHMGWNDLTVVRSHPIVSGVSDAAAERSNDDGATSERGDESGGKDGDVGGRGDGQSGGSVDGQSGGSVDGHTGRSGDGHSGGSVDGHSGGSVDGNTGRSGDGHSGGSVDGEYAYFVHSFYAVPDDESAVVATADYGGPFPAVIADESGTVFGTQFHPEKSGVVGLRLLRNFVDCCARP